MILAFLFRYWKYILIVLLVVGLYFAAVNWRENDIQRWKDAGRAELQAEFDQAKKEADEATRKKQSKIVTKTKEAVHEARKKQGADAPASDYLRSIVDSLR